jgi:hypothetical protein
VARRMTTASGDRDGERVRPDMTKMMGFQGQ